MTWAPGKAIKRHMNGNVKPWLKPIVDFGPIAVFFLAYWKAGLFAATGALMVAAVVVLALSWGMERRVPIVPLVTAAIVLVFGGLTLALDDERFIKMKPTIVQMLFAAILFGGLILDRPLLKPLFGSAWQLEDRGWRLLTIRFGIFFVVMAGLNELVWRTQTTDVWVSFKVFGIMGLTFMFMTTQIPLIQRYLIKDEK